jgi:hypothetical protein
MNAKDETEKLTAEGSARELCDETAIRAKLDEVLGVVSMSYIAKEYFHKSKSWFSQKLNGKIKYGTSPSFTKDELKTLAFALQDIGVKLRKTARSI